MAAQKTQQSFVRWTSLRGITSILVFLILAILIECAIILYANGLGLTENSDTRIFGVISPLFHLVPAAVIITLVFSWTYLTKCMTIKTLEIAKKKALTAKKEKPKKSFFDGLKAKILSAKIFVSFQQKMANVTVKSALTILLLFTVFAFTVFLLAYPRIIYEAIANAYRNNTALLNFVKGTTEALAPIFWIFSAVGNALVSFAPAFRDFVLTLGAIINPLVSLDAAGKYLAVQNAAAWISALIALTYGEYARKGRKYGIRRKG
ncbi:MAG: hypothetical protein ACPL0C_00210 [Candidatus Bathyarchaeales archaeon]